MDAIQRFTENVVRTTYEMLLGLGSGSDEDVYPSILWGSAWRVPPAQG